MTTNGHSPKKAWTGSDLSRLRNIGIIAHVDAGKTTVTERVLFFTGETYKIGSVDDGTAQMDHMAQERERGITITAAATNASWNNHQINIIDTPGHVDFTAEVERSLRILDGVVVVLDSVAGVQAQSVTVWRQADNHHVPRIVFVNKMDRIGADFDFATSTLSMRLHANAVPIQMPIGQESEFQGTIDLVTMRAYVYDSDDAIDPRETEIPAEYADRAESAREELVAKVAEFDDELTDMYLNGDDISPADLKRAIRSATINMQIFPVMAGSARTHRGVHQMLDAVVDYLPSPLDLPPVKGFKPNDPDVEIERRPSVEDPFSGLAFKLVTDEHSGRLLFLRIYSGVLKEGSYVYNPSTRKRERISRLLRMHADTREAVKEAGPGEIVAAIGLKQTTTGHTLCAEHAHVALAQIEFPDPVLSIAVEAESRSDSDRMTESLMKLRDEDPTLTLTTDDESGQQILAGMGELHLDIIVDRLFREFRVKASKGRPRVAYRETVSNIVEVEGKHVKQTGGHGQYGICKLRLEPLPPGSGIQFESEITGAVLKTDWHKAVEKGVHDAAKSGVIAGHPVVDVKAVLIDGKEHDTDSSEIAFQIAGSLAFQAGLRRGGARLLEPIMLLEVVAPSGSVGDLIGDLNSRRAKVQQLDTESKGGNGVVNIRAFIPLAETFNYSTDLRSITSGDVEFSMELDHYDSVPQHVVEALKV